MKEQGEEVEGRYDVLEQQMYVLKDFFTKFKPIRNIMREVFMFQ